jgi:hypothetical protein
MAVYCARGRRLRAVHRDCGKVQGWKGQHSRWERLIGSAVPVQALLSDIARLLPHRRLFLL